MHLTINTTYTTLELAINNSNGVKTGVWRSGADFCVRSIHLARSVRPNLQQSNTQVNVHRDGC